MFSRVTTLLLCLLSGCALLPPRAARPPDVYDVVIYGGTSAGIAAAVQVRRMGGSVIVLEPTTRIGGLTTGGLGQTDIGNKAAIGGIAREFYRRVRAHYSVDDHWHHQAREDYRSGGQSRTGSSEDAMWTFEPSAALAIFESWVRENDFAVVRGERLDRTRISPGSTRVRGVVKEAGEIRAITMESGLTVRGRVFIDATYEGDLMAGAGVAYRIGREGNAEHGETLNGVRTSNAMHHQFRPGVDPYIEAGDPASGLLPGIDADGPGVEGSADHRVQAFCFRMCLTDHPENRIPFAKPEGYDPLEYELLLRNFEAGARVVPWHNSRMPNRKTDTNNNRGFSTDFIGRNYAYPDGSYAERERIVAEHRRYQQGLMWTLANHPRVPERIRRDVSRWGTCRDEFARDDGWQEQLYIREARRMVGAVVMTQHHCQGRVVVERPVGLAAYTMDSHNVQRYVNAAGEVRNEGDVQVGGFAPYPIDYGAIVPRRRHCTNLLVPVCLSATHIAFGSIRMEPVFMVLGQSAGAAAVLAARDSVDVQSVAYDELRARLLAESQVLAWSPVTEAAAGVAPESLPGIVVDDAACERAGFATPSTSVTPFVGAGYRHDGNAAKGRQRARYSLRVPRRGTYEVKISWTAHANRAANVPVSIRHADGETLIRVDQRREPDSDGFGTLGKYDFDAGEALVEIRNDDTEGFVIIDAVQLIEAP